MRNWTADRLTATAISSRPVRRVGAGGAQHPFADRHDQPVRLGDRDEVVGRDHAAGRMAPAQQRLEAGDATAGNVDQRLVMDLELAFGQRAAQIGFELPSLQGGALQVLLEEAMAASPLRLRLVEREVGVLGQFVGVGAVGGEQRDADAGADRHFDSVDRIRLRQGLDHPRRRRVDRVRRGDRVEDDGEFVAAEPRREVAFAERVAQALRRHAQQPVAGRMAVGVVDVLELVEVDAADRQPPPVGAAGLDRARQAGAEVGAVAQAGQRVVASQIGGLGLGAFALGDVGDRRQLGRVAGVGDGAGEGERVDRLAVGAAMALVASGAVVALRRALRPLRRRRAAVRPPSWRESAGANSRNARSRRR